MFDLLTITHDFGRGLSIGDYTLRIYQLMFLVSFIAGFQFLKYIFKKEGADEKWMDSLLTYGVVATVLGARLGHVFFYQPDYYLSHPAEILMVWKGGLASHGAAIALIIAMFMFSKKISKTPPLWILDRFVIVVALAAAFIRIGNYTNSEIYGRVANSSTETVFLFPVQDYMKSAYSSFVYDVDFEESEERFDTDSLSFPVYNMTVETKQGVDAKLLVMKFQNEIIPRFNLFADDDKNVLPHPNAEIEVIGAEKLRVKVLGVPRYPTQLYEAVGYLLIFLILLFFYFKTEKKYHLGFLFGLFLILLFGYRFFIEHFKANQVDFENNYSLNMGQILSIPLVLLGLYMVLTSKKRFFKFEKK